MSKRKGKGKRRLFNRRDFLLGAAATGVVGLTLPILPSFGRAADGQFPKRLVVFFSGNGTIASNWVPQSSNGRLTQLSEILEPLDRHIDDITVIEGLDLNSAYHKWQPIEGFHAHERGIGGILTGQHLQTGDFEAGSGYANGISVDQFIANGMAGQTPLHSLQVGLVSRRHGRGWYNRDTMVYTGPGQAALMEYNGEKLFDQIFGDGPSTPAVYERIRERRGSVLDFLRDDLSRVERKISRADRQRLEQHHTAFRELETKLEEPLPTCGSDQAPSVDSWADEANMDTISEIQIRQTVQALACDRTRVAAIQFGKGLGGFSMRCIGVDSGWHGTSHEGDHNDTAVHRLTQMNRYIATRFALLLDEMKAVPEGDGTLLDNSVVLWVNELGKGNSHSKNDVPIVMAGHLDGFFKPGGRHISFGDRPHNDLLITLCHAFGHTDVTEFGIPELCSGPLDELIA